MTDNDDLHFVLRELSNLLISEETLRSSLRRVAVLSVRAIEACDAAGVSVIDGAEVVTAAGSDEHVEALDDLQYRSGEGPCLQATRDGRIFRSHPVIDDIRWPAFGMLASQHGVKACLAVPLLEEGACLGALNLYSYRDQPFGAVDEESAVMLAAQASGPLSDMRRYSALQNAASQLTRLMDSHVPVAIGILMERNGCSREEAVALLMRMAAGDRSGVEDAVGTVLGSAVTARTPEDLPVVEPPLSG